MRTAGTDAALNHREGGRTRIGDRSHGQRYEDGDPEAALRHVRAMICRHPLVWGDRARLGVWDRWFKRAVGRRDSLKLLAEQTGRRWFHGQRAAAAAFL